jgi:hypothetical protein
MVSNQDLNEILDEARSMLKEKLGAEVSLDFRDAGVISIDEFFKMTNYETDPYFEYFKTVQYRLDAVPPFDKKKAEIIDFLKQWDLKSLAGYFPGQTVNSYEDVYGLLIRTYQEKVEALKRIHLKDGTPLLYPEGKAFQSYANWEGIMHAQDRYDLVVTNTLIMYDLYTRPYPHAVCKHAKVSGGSYDSPKRSVLGGKSIMVNVLEQYGEIPELNYNAGDVPRGLRNKAIGGVMLAHEFGHAFYFIPDVYEHGDQCLMNSSFENLNNIKAFEFLQQGKGVCPRCRPYVVAKNLFLSAEEAFREKRFSQAGDLYLESALKTPPVININRSEYVNHLLDLAEAAYQKGKNVEGSAKIKAARQE